MKKGITFKVKRCGPRTAYVYVEERIPHWAVMRIKIFEQTNGEACKEHAVLACQKLAKVLNDALDKQMNLEKEPK